MTSNSSSSMRGLTQYIADLRACRVRELEEKRINKEMAHIRQKFKEGQLDGYQKKKYLSKIVFTYILGYQVDVGHVEAVNLISSTKYSEKQIGYLAVTLLMHENSDLIRLVVNSIRKDLDENSEVNNCLALHAIANIGGREMAGALSNDVHRLLISPTSRSFVKKKAALTLLRLYRKHPDVIPAEEWAIRIISLMDDDNLGVALAVTSLVMAMAQEHPEAFASSYQKAVARLYRIVVENEYSAEYVYYKVPIPWLQIKLLRLLQYYPTSQDGSLNSTITTVLDTIIDTSQNTPKNVQHNNAQNAVLFEAINVAIQIDTESPTVAKAAALLGRFILSRETNVRYLGLDTMAHLAARSESLEPIKMHQNTIILSLRDKDISVRRRGLDLLYSMCDVTNAKVIVSELLKYMHVADYALREEMVLKIAILTEKFATEYTWYVDTILQLISSAGDHVSEEVWYRVIQIVVNNEDVQEYAAHKVLEHLKSSSCHENLIKVGGYVLGEFGHLVANEPGASPIEQFHTLHSRSHLCSQPTRALLLSTYIKWLNLFPEIREQILYVLNRYRHVLDAELQQRACEYVMLAELPTDDLLQAVCDEMPPFAEKSSLLLSRLHKKHADTEDKRTWVIGGKDTNRGRDQARMESLKKGKANGGAMPTGGAAATVIPAGHRSEAVTADSMRDAYGSASDNKDMLIGLEGLDMNAPGEDTGMQQNLIVDESAPIMASTPVRETPPLLSTASFTPGADKAFQRLCFVDEGVLHEDSQLQVGLKTEYHGSQGRLALYFGNKIAVDFRSFTVTVKSQDTENLSVTLPKIPTNVLGAMTQAQTVVLVDCHEAFTKAPILHISYLAGSLHEVRVRLPVLIHKFIEPVQLSGADFFERWRQIGGPPREAQKIFGLTLSASTGEVDVVRQRRVIQGSHMQHLESVDPNPTNSVGAGVLHMSRGGKVGCLLRLEPNRDAKLARLTLRTTNDLISAELLRILSTVLGNEHAKL